jgi:hypothetical protein
MLKDMKEQGVIKELDSSWYSPIMLIRNNVDLHFCVDYRKLDDVTKDCFLLPRIDNTLDMLIRTSTDKSSTCALTTLPSPA